MGGRSFLPDLRGVPCPHPPRANLGLRPRAGSPAGAAEVPGLSPAAQAGTVWGPLAAQERGELHAMETDHSRFAIAHEPRQSAEKPTTALQLLSGCRERARAPTALREGEGRWGGQGLGSPPRL